MRTYPNSENVQENEGVRKLYLNSVREEIAEDRGFMVSNALAGEITGKVTAGFTVITYRTFWKIFYTEHWTYNLNYGHFV